MTALQSLNQKRFALQTGRAASIFTPMGVQVEIDRSAAKRLQARLQALESTLPIFLS
jgi:hypothetical protein